MNPEANVERELQKLQLEANRLTSKLITISNYPVLNRSLGLVSRKMGDIASKSVLASDIRFDSVDLRLSEQYLQSLKEYVETVSKLAATPETVKAPVDSAEIAAKKKAELEAAERAKAAKQVSDKISSMIEFSKVPQFATVVSKLNEHRLKRAGGKLNVFEEFAECSRTSGIDLRAEQLADCWSALSELMGEDKNENVFGLTPPSAALNWSETIITRSRKVLEESYLKFIDRTLSQNPRESVLGGRPSIVDRIRAFCVIRAKRLSPSEIENIEASDGNAPWMVMFYLLRCGLFREINELLTSPSGYYIRSDSVLHGFLKAFLNSDSHQLSLPQLAQMQAEFNQRMLQGSQDPFKMAIFKLIGKCELQKKSIPEIVLTCEDYLWLQLWLIGNDGASLVPYTLKDLQSLVVSLGPNHFSGAPAGRLANPLNYFQMLLLTGQFERAVDCLVGTHYHIEAVHMAIGLLHYQKLSTSLANGIEYLHNNQMDYYRMVDEYLPIVRSIDRQYELQYILTLTMADQYIEKSHQMIRGMILHEGSDLTLLLGDVMSDGQVTEGKVKHFASLLKLPHQQDFIQTIIVKCAEVCIENDRIVEALQLFNLSKQYDTVLIYLNQQLSKVFSRLQSRESTLQLTSMAQSIIDYYSKESDIVSKLSPSRQQTTLILLRLLNIKHLHADREFERALASIELLELVPLSGAIQSIQQSADKILRSLDDSLLANLSNILLLTMQIIYSNYSKIRQSCGLDAGRQQQVQALRSKAKALLLFSSFLHQQVSTEVCGQLAKMEVLMS